MDKEQLLKLLRTGQVILRVILKIPRFSQNVYLLGLATVLKFLEENPDLIQSIFDLFLAKGLMVRLQPVLDRVAMVGLPEDLTQEQLMTLGNELVEALEAPHGWAA